MINSRRSIQLKVAKTVCDEDGLLVARDYLLACKWSVEAVDFLYPIN